MRKEVLMHLGKHNLSRSVSWGKGILKASTDGKELGDLWIRRWQ